MVETSFLHQIFCLRLPNAQDARPIFRLIPSEDPGTTDPRNSNDFTFFTISLPILISDGESEIILHLSAFTFTPILLHALDSSSVERDNFLKSLQIMLCHQHIRQQKKLLGFKKSFAVDFLVPILQILKRC